MERRSKWLKPGWFVAFCQDCPYFCVIPNETIRDDWAAQHEQNFRHHVDCIDGE